MARALPAAILRAREDRPRISYLELFFDLGLIVALSRLSLRLTSDLGWFNALETMVLLAAVWWLWTVTAYLTDWYNPEVPLVRAIVLVTMLGGLLMSAAVLRAFEGLEGIAFAGAYVGVHVVRGLIIVTALRGHPQRRRPLRNLIWFSLTGILWLTGALLPAPARLAVWAVAVVIEYSVGLFGQALPRLGRNAPEELRVVGEHVSERYRQMLVIALGEIILLGATKYGDASFGSPQTVGFILLFVNAVALWRLYVVYVGQHLAAGIDRSAQQGRTALVAAYAHLIMVAGVVLTAAGGEILVTEPTHEASPGWLAVLIAGPVVFLIGRAVYAAEVYRTVWWRLPVAALVILALTPALMHLSPLGMAGILDAVLVIIAFSPAAGPAPHRLARRIEPRW